MSVENLINIGATTGKSCNSAKWTALHYAAENGYLELVQSLLNNGADFHAKTTSGVTPLLLAADNKHEGIVKLLITAGADINCSFGLHNFTVMHYASENGWQEIVQFLLNKGADFHAKTTSDVTPLLLAALNKHEGIVKLLITAGADKNCALSMDNYTVMHCAAENGWQEIVQCLLYKGADFHARTKSGVVPLLLAADNKHEGIVKLLITAGADINCSFGLLNYTVMHYASVYGWQEIVQSLLNKGADFHAKTTSNVTPLLLAAHYQHKGIVKLLITAGADINCSISTDNYTVMHYAAENGWQEIVQSLLNKGADLNAKTKSGVTPLLLAAHSKHEGIVKFLITAGADINCSFSMNNYTVMHYASENRWLETVQSLLNKGADFHAKTTSGVTPLLLAADNKHEVIVKLLITAGADINCSFGLLNYTVMHYAAVYGWQEIVQSLLNKSANINAKSRSGATPLLLAAHNRHEGIVKLLITAGADINCSFGNYDFTVLHYATTNGWAEIVQSLLRQGVNIEAKSSNGTSLQLAINLNKIEILQHLVNAGANCNIIILSKLFNKSPDINIIRLLIKHGAYLKFFDYERIVQNSLLKEHILQDHELCFQVIINEFNHKHLPKLYNLSVVRKVLPHIENMRIGNLESNTHSNVSQVTHEVLQKSVKQEIKVKGHCNLLKPRPIVLKMMAVKSFLSYYRKIKKNYASIQIKRSADDNQHTKPHSSKILCAK